jgi:hypothetical protein
MKNIVFLPIDIDLTELNFQQLDNTSKAGKWNGYWDASFINEETVKQTNLDRVLNQLPFTRLTRLLHKVQTVAVSAHLDCSTDMIYEEGEHDYIKSIEPSGYRLVLSGSTKALWVYDNKEWHNVTLPSVPCCYVLNASAGIHKLEADVGRETIFTRGYVDLEKHQEILKRSLEKYRDYAVYFQ